MSGESSLQTTGGKTWKNDLLIAPILSYLWTLETHVFNTYEDVIECSIRKDVNKTLTWFLRRYGKQGETRQHQFFISKLLRGRNCIVSREKTNLHGPNCSSQWWLDYYLERLMFANVTFINIAYWDSKVTKSDFSKVSLLYLFFFFFSP